MATLAALAPLLVLHVLTLVMLTLALAALVTLVATLPVSLCGAATFVWYCSEWHWSACIFVETDAQQGCPETPHWSIVACFLHESVDCAKVEEALAVCATAALLGAFGAVAGAVDAGAEGVGAAEDADVERSSAPLRAAAPATMPRRRAAAQQRLERLTGTRGARHQSAAITAAATARRRTRWRVRTAAAGSATALPAAPSISAPLRCISFSL
jgi:hypothetical protein